MHLAYTPERQRIAIQKKGRLYDASIEYLAARGLSFPDSGRSLIQSSQSADVDVLYLRDDDIPEYVSRGVADLGIVGENVLAERGLDLPIVERLDFGRCKLVIAVPKEARVRNPQDLEGKRIATSYPKLLSDFLKKEGVEADIITVSGSAEIAPELDMADAICDIVQSGATLEAHDLVPLCTVMESQAVLVRGPSKTRAQENLVTKLTAKAV